MASNFRVLIHRNSDNIHLKLKGDFDGSSALQLIHLLKSSCGKSLKIFIHTGCLNRVAPFGKKVFQENIRSLNESVGDLVFTGEKAALLSRES